MKTAVIGASGYLGAELMRLLAGHPDFDVTSAQSDSTAGEELGSLYPGLEQFYEGMRLGAPDASALEGYDVVFVAVPSGASQDLVPQLLGRVGLVVDLGADFRLKDPLLYEQWYHFKHRAPELLSQSVLGLVELYRSELLGAHFIAAPGCYVTAASLALAPLVKAGLLETGSIIVDAASGTSGAGKSPSPAMQYGKVTENFSAYGLLHHRHTPEIEQVIGAQILFTPHLAPMFRGILATCYAKATRPTSEEEILELLGDAYEKDAFVHVSENLPSTRDTYGINTCRLTARFDERGGHVIVLSALDNLTKGGSGQAIQAANVALGLDETTGLSKTALVP